MRYLYIVIAIIYNIFNISECFAQGETWNWYFGDSAGIYFPKGKNPVRVLTYKDWSYGGTAIVSDKNGALEYYTNGITIYNKSNDSLNIGNELKGGYASSQPVVMVRHPKSNTLNILTTSTLDGASSYGYHYSSFENNKFSLFNKVLQKHIGDKQACVNARDNNNIWLSSHSLLNDTFYNYILTKNGLVECPVINKIGPKYQDRYPSQGVLKYSPSGNLCANANWDLSTLNLFNFDNATGRYTNIITINQFYPYAIEFSPDEKYLYVTDRGLNIYQYSLKYMRADSIAKSKKTVYSISGQEFFQMQLASDGRIYTTVYGKTFLGCINEPNRKGDSCNYVYNALSLGNRKNWGGLPLFNASFLNKPCIDFSYEQDCRTNTINFQGVDTFNATSYIWIFKKGNDSIIKATKNITITFNDTGKWYVTFIASTGSRTDTVSKFITILPILKQHFLGGDIYSCNKKPIILHAPKELHCVHWYDASANELDKTDTLRIDSTGTFYCKATNKSFCIEWDTIRILNNPPQQFKSIVKSCNNYKSPSGKYIWTSSGTYLDTITSQYGCDSAIKIQLTIVKSSSYFLNISVCNKYTLPSGKRIVTTSGIYSDTINNKAGCDSIITIELVIVSSTYSSITPTTCNSYSSPSGKFTWNTSGNYKDTIPNKEGCDSIIIVNLKVIGIDTNVVVNDPVLTAVANGAKYQWLDCNDNFKVITGEVKPSFAAKHNGSYAVLITISGCSARSKCYSVQKAMVENSFKERNIHIFPNPTSGLVDIQTTELFGNTTVKVLTINGQTLVECSFERINEIYLDLSHFPKGIYLIEIDNNGQLSTFKLVKL